MVYPQYIQYRKLKFNLSLCEETQFVSSLVQIRLHYFPFNFVIVLAKASPFRSMAYSTVSLEPVDDVLRSVS